MSQYVQLSVDEDEAPLDEDNPLLLQGGSDGHLEAQQRNDSPDQGLQIEVKAAIGDQVMTRPRMILMSVLGLVVLSSLLYFFSLDEPKRKRDHMLWPGAPWNTIPDWAPYPTTGGIQGGAAVTKEEFVPPGEGIEKPGDNLQFRTIGGRDITMDGSETMMVFVDVWGCGGNDVAMGAGDTPLGRYGEASAEVVRRLRPYGVRVAFSPSNTLDNYVGTGALKNADSAITGCRDRVRAGLSSDRAESIRWYLHYSDNNKKVCNAEGPECTVFATQRILNAMTRRNQSVHYNNGKATKERCIFWGKADENQGRWCRTGEGCPDNFREKDVNGKCWKNTGFPWFRQDADLDTVVNHTEDAYVEDFEKAHCFAQKHGIKNIIMAGGDALMCLTTRKVGMYFWVRAGYRVYAMADLVLKESAIPRSFIHGVYAGLGVKVIEMNMTLGT